MGNGASIESKGGISTSVSNYNLRENGATVYTESEKLMLQKKNMETIPKNFFESFPNTIRWINLNDNNLFKDRDNTVAQLKMFKLLERLELANNKLVKIPVDICLIETLTVLDLGRNKLTSLPKQIAQCHNLETLFLSDNQIDSNSLRSISEISSLVTLDLVSNKLSDSNFPGRTRWSNLTSLDLSANLLSTLPLSLCELSSLTNLVVSSNQIRSLPLEIANLTNLSNLDISSNQLRELPKTLGKLQKLKVLILNFNKLEELPEDIARMQQLTELQVRWNSLYEFPICTTKIPSLQILDFWSNHIHTIPPAISKLTNLQFLNLSSNEIVLVPSQVSHLISLRKLDVSYNQLHDLPAELGNIGLRELIVDNNPLMERLRAVAAKGTGELLRYLKGNILHVKPDGSVRRDSVWRVEDAFDCVYCSDILYLPKTSSCGHNFCSPCLKDLVEYNQRCPHCRNNLTTLDEEQPINKILLDSINSKYPEKYKERAAIEEKRAFAV